MTQRTLLTNPIDMYIHTYSVVHVPERIFAGAIVVPLDDERYVYDPDSKTFVRAQRNKNTVYSSNGKRLYRHVLVNNKTGYVATFYLKPI